MGRDENYLRFASLNSHLVDVCLKGSCKICELEFLLGRRCRKEMVRAAIEHALSEISRPWELLKQMFLRPEVILRETKTMTKYVCYDKVNTHQCPE